MTLQRPESIDAALALLAACSPATEAPETGATETAEAPTADMAPAFTLVDAEGVERLRMDRRVPIGEKQHLHPGDAVGFHPPAISFTIHRVGLHHLWSRL